MRIRYVMSREGRSPRMHHENQITAPQLGLGHFSLVDNGFSNVEEDTCTHNRTRVRGAQSIFQSPEVSWKQHDVLRGNFMKFSRVELFLALSFTGASNDDKWQWAPRREEPMRYRAVVESLSLGYLCLPLFLAYCSSL
jgi:hypothetical protein